ncbi:MAG: hypothetical protein E7331_06950 [Clostridiales bacterium]|nr:hypothetical protein [Clostridiales bacterium]
MPATPCPHTFQNTPCTPKGLVTALRKAASSTRGRPQISMIICIL